MKSSKLLRANRLRLLSIAPSERGMPRTQPASAPQNGSSYPLVGLTKVAYGFFLALHHITQAAIGTTACILAKPGVPVSAGCKTASIPSQPSPALLHGRASCHSCQGNPSRELPDTKALEIKPAARVTRVKHPTARDASSRI